MQPSHPAAAAAAQGQMQPRGGFPPGFGPSRAPAPDMALFFQHVSTIDQQAYTIDQQTKILHKRDATIADLMQQLAHANSINQSLHDAGNKFFEERKAMLLRVKELEDANAKLRADGEHASAKKVAEAAAEAVFNFEDVAAKFSQERFEKAEQEASRLKKELDFVQAKLDIALDRIDVLRANQKGFVEDERHLKGQKAALIRENDALKQDNDDLKASLRKTQSEKDKALRNVKSLQAQVSELATQLKAKNEEVKALQTKLGAEQGKAVMSLIFGAAQEPLKAAEVVAAPMSAAVAAGAAAAAVSAAEAAAAPVSVVVCTAPAPVKVETVQVPVDLEGVTL